MSCGRAHIVLSDVDTEEEVEEEEVDEEEVDEVEETDFPLYWPADYSQSAARNVKVLRASDYTGGERGEGGEGEEGGGGGQLSVSLSRHLASSREASKHH